MYVVLTREACGVYQLLHAHIRTYTHTHTHTHKHTHTHTHTHTRTNTHAHAHTHTLTHTHIHTHTRTHTHTHTHTRTHLHIQKMQLQLPVGSALSITALHHIQKELDEGHVRFKTQKKNQKSPLKAVRHNPLRNINEEVLLQTFPRRSMIAIISCSPSVVLSSGGDGV